MANSYKTPGVYVEEIPKLPPSVADVPTAIPAFIGFTEKAFDGNNDLTNKPKKITSMLDFERFFGTGPKLSVNEKAEIKDSKFVLYDSIRLFYDNGGGVCYIVSIGDFQAKPNADLYIKGIKTIETIDEVTLLVMPDAATTLNKEDLAAVQQAALKQCKELQDRFAILDVKLDNSKEGVDEDISNFRDNIGTQNINYGAAYYPYISTVYKHDFEFGDVIQYMINKDIIGLSQLLDYCKEPTQCITICRSVNQPEKKNETEINNYINSLSDENLIALYKPENITYDIVGSIIKVDNKRIVTYDYGLTAPPASLALPAEKDKDKLEAFKEYVISILKKEKPHYTLSQLEAEYDNLTVENKIIKGNLFLHRDNIVGQINTKIDALKSKSTKDDALKYLRENVFNITQDPGLLQHQQALIELIPYYKLTVDKLNSIVSLIPPSGAIAGIYAQSDNYSGVWSAPANMSLSSVKGVARLINNQMQEDMNVHMSGKSINAIRPFSGKGVMVWGARTLQGNDNEWRYVPVRRLFIYVEESVKKSTEWAVFSPNNQNTWTKIKSQIENFLINLWRAGALAGSTPAEAFQVKVGLNLTMDVNDILEGRLIIEIGLAAVRPAEFIILRFSHKVQES